MINIEAQDDKINIDDLMLDIGRRAKVASDELANAATEQKNLALVEIANAIEKNARGIISANNKDMEIARKKNLESSMLDRLLLNEERIKSIKTSLLEISELEEPVDKILSSWERPNGLKIKKVSVPLGVIGIIYESRPNVTADAGALCLKSGNASILRGGSESFFSSQMIVHCIQIGLQKAGLSKDAIQLVPTRDRRAVTSMLQMSDFIDVIVPRGGKGLCSKVQNESKVATLLHLDGNCHSYIHQDADLATAIDVVVNAKTRRAGICGATESIVIDAGAVEKIFPKLSHALFREGCQIKADKQLLKYDERLKEATEDDYYTEYLDKIVSVKMVDNAKEAISFVNEHSSHHTDCIITENQDVANEFTKKINSAIVMHNTSTQFADGGEFGMGAEIGISTGKLHARGPVGVEQLTTFKYIVQSDGATRE